MKALTNWGEASNLRVESPACENVGAAVLGIACLTTPGTSSFVKYSMLKYELQVLNVLYGIGRDRH